MPTALPHHLRCLLAGALVALALGLLGPLTEPATANPAQISIMQDDDSLIYAQDALQKGTLTRMAHLGVNWVRATVLWSAVAYGTQDPRHNHRFDPTNPRSYRRGSWANYDRLVRHAAELGITVYFNVTGPGPAWAMGTTSIAKLKKAWMPDPVQFGKFVQAVGTRYSGNYPNGPGKAGNLPRMNAWSIWNEPNWPTWLAPQSVYSPRLHTQVPYAPMLYRRLTFAARRGLDASGHAGDLVMLGETQPLGSGPAGESAPLLPALFLREMMCLRPSFRPFTGAAAAERGCGDWARHRVLRITAYAHHPYTKSDPPSHVDPRADAITMGNIGALPSLLDRIARATSRIPERLPILVTEMGYSSNPPNPYRGVSLARQAEYLNQSDYLAYKQPRVYSMTQFLYRDSPPVRTAPKGSRAYWATFQTGITFLDGTPKPSYAAYALPIWVRPGTDSNGGSHLELWAQVRFRRVASAQDAVVFQYRAPGEQSWRTITAPQPITASLGFVDTTVPRAPYASGGAIRAVWGGPVAPYFAVSRTAMLP